MKITEFKKNTYKSFIESTEITFDKGFSVVGKNNVGKSALLGCLSISFPSKPNVSRKQKGVTPLILLLLATLFITACDDVDVIQSRDSLVPVLGGSPKGIAFDEQDKIFIVTAAGSIYRLDGLNLNKLFELDSLVNGAHHIRYRNNMLFVHHTKSDPDAPDTNQIDEVLLYNNIGEFIDVILDDTITGVSFFSDIVVNSAMQLYLQQFPIPEEIFTFNDYVVRLDKDGSNLITVVDKNEDSSILGTLAINSRDEIYVGSNSGVNKFDVDGNFLAAIAQDGVDGFEDADIITIDSNDDLYILNNMFMNATSTQFTVLKYASNGGFLGEIFGTGGFSVEGVINDIGVDSQGNIYIVGFDINMFDSQGNFIRKVARSF